MAWRRRHAAVFGTCESYLDVHSLQGTTTVPDLSQEQVDGMAGGDTLRSQTLAFGVVRNAKQLQKGAARLLSALQQVLLKHFHPERLHHHLVPVTTVDCQLGWHMS